MKVCICFFGLVHRSLKYTIDSINKNIFKVLNDNNIEYDIYLHTYDTSSALAYRGNEINVPINLNDIKLLNATCIEIDNEDEFNRTFDFDSFINSTEFTGFSTDNNYNIHRNLIRELNSHNKVTQLWKNKNHNYDFAIYLRADLLYVTKLPIQYIIENINQFNWKYYIDKYEDLQKANIDTEDKAFQHWNIFGRDEGRLHANNIFTVPWGKHTGLNDFIAIGNIDSIIKWAERINDLKYYKQLFNSEAFVYHVANRYNIYNIDLPMLINRVRANSNICNEEWMKNNYINFKNNTISNYGTNI
jgi:hypothetical protein